MKKFEMLLKNEKEKAYKVISWIIIISNIAFFLFLAASGNFKKIGPVVIVLLTIFSIFVTHYFPNKGEKFKFMGAYIILDIGWLMTPYWWVAFVNVVFQALEQVAGRQLIVSVLPEKIIYPSWPKKEIHWEELSNLILKDGLLTIDFKNNKIIQQLIINKEADYDNYEKEFNSFCREQLYNRSSRPGN